IPDVIVQVERTEDVVSYRYIAIPNANFGGRFDRHVIYQSWGVTAEKELTANPKGPAAGKTVLSDVLMKGKLGTKADFRVVGPIFTLAAQTVFNWVLSDTPHPPATLQFRAISSYVEVSQENSVLLAEWMRYSAAFGRRMGALNVVQDIESRLK